MEQEIKATESNGAFNEIAELEIFQYIHMLRRRWWVIALGALLAGASYAGYAKMSPPLFTAEAVLQRQTAPTGMDALRFNTGVNDPAMMNTVVEVVRSVAVLQPAVDSLGFRLSISGNLTLRSRLIGQVEVGRDVGGLSMMLEQRDGGVVLLDPETNEVLSVSDPLGWVSARGVRFQVLSPELVTEPIAVSVLFPEDAVARLRSLLIAQRVRNTLNLINLYITSTDAEFSARAVNTIAAEYQSFVALRSARNATRSRMFVEEQLAQISDSLDLARSHLVDYQNTARTLDPILESTILADRMTTAQEELRMLEFTELVLQDLLTSLNSGVSPTDAFQGIMAIGRDMVPGIELTYSKLQELYEERSRLTSGQFGFTAQGPQVQVLDSLISETRSDIRGMVNQSLSLVTSRRIAEEQQVEILESSLQELPGRSSTFGSLQEEVEAVKQIYDILVASYYETRMLEAVETSDVEVLSFASVPLRPDDPNTIRNLILAMIAGLSFGAGVVVILESLDTKIRDVREAQRMVSVDVLGVIPKQNSSRNSRGRGKDGSSKGDPFQEAFGGLRTGIHFSATLDPDKTSVILVTSPGPGEGKSTVAANLARSLSLQDQKVLLVDADLRRPTVHKQLGLPNEIGLGDYLRDPTKNLGLRSYQRLEETDIYAICSGTKISNPSEVLGGKRLKSLLDDARDEFDAIIVDTPPVLAVTDTLLIAEACDAVLMVGRIDQTDRFSLRRAMQELGRVTTPVMGLVVNDMKARGGGYSYGGYYGYYGSYGY